MVKNKLYSTLIVAGITGSLIISTGFVAFASSSKLTTTPKTKICSNGFMKKGGKQRENPLVSVLKTQVTAGVITQAEADKVTAFLKTKENARKVEMIAQKAKYDAMTDAQKALNKVNKKAVRDAEKVKLDAMTSVEREAYMKANRPAQKGIFTDLVNAGILTQSKVDKIQASIPKRFVEVPTNDAKAAK